MHLSVAAARGLALAILARHGFAGEDASLITDVLVEAHLWGRGSSGLNHLRHICEAGERQPVRIVSEDDHGAVIDGGHNPGFLVASRAMLVAIAKAKRSGLALVGARNSYMGGLNGHYVAMAAREDLIAMTAISGAARVAPSGAADALIGTNPIAFAVPTLGEPLVLDMATAATNHGSILRAARLGERLPEGLAIGPDGEDTTDPQAALAGAILPFGGHKGGGLALIVQCLGILAGGAVSTSEVRDFGYFFLVVDPARFMPVADYKARVSELVERVHAARPRPGIAKVMVPGERGQAERKRRLAEGFDIDEPLYRELKKLAGEG